MNQRFTKGNKRIEESCDFRLRLRVVSRMEVERFLAGVIREWKSAGGPARNDKGMGVVSRVEVERFLAGGDGEWKSVEGPARNDMRQFLRDLSSCLGLWVIWNDMIGFKGICTAV